MNGMFSDVMTVYNHYIEEGADKWRRTIVKGVQWSHNRVKTGVAGGVQTETIAESITVDFSRSYGNDAYVLPNAYTGLSGWTLNNRNALDVLVLGEVSQEITSEYPIDKLREDNQYVGTVMQVSDNRNRERLKNIKVVVQ